MTRPLAPTLSSRGLRSQLSYLNAERARKFPHELSFGEVPSVVYGFTEDGHGNFLKASLRRILADPRWAARLRKAYTGAHRLPRAHDRRRGELECAASSDALLMNIFCYPGVLRRAAVCAYLGVSAGCRPTFGVRVALPMQRNEVDRTEMDMRLGDLLVEAKLTESGFGVASTERLLRYLHVEENFTVERLPQRGGRFVGYQIVRGLLAARRHDMRYTVVLDERRDDLREICFRILCAVRDPEVQGRFRLITWQELTSTLPRVPQQFLSEKFGILPA